MIIELPFFLVSPPRLASLLRLLTITIYLLATLVCLARRQKSPRLLVLRGPREAGSGLQGRRV